MTVFTGFLLFAALALLAVQRITTLLTYFQQEEYDGRRFLVACLTVRLFDIRATAATLVALWAMAAGVPQGLCLVALAAGFAAIAYLERNHRYKKPLARTERAMRIHRLAASALGIAALLVLLHPAYAMVVLQAAPLVLIAANAVLQPLQDRINARFVGEASGKLERLDPVRIGITGSFGKTTVKHMLADVLQASGPVFYSPGSINTVLGHTRHIRQRLQWAHKYFIAEMGAYGIGSIKRLCDFIHPTYGIVTAVGDAHTERFGSLEAIAQAKSELAAETCALGGTVVVNADLLAYAPFRRLKAQYGARVVTVGDGAGAEVRITAAEIAGGAWSITLQSDDPRVPGVTYELPLIGEHNVLNSALAVTLALIIDRSIAAQIPYLTRSIAQVPHRLQKVGAPGHALVLDDAYNSNERGFMSAVSALDKLARERGGRRILVTPGIAELGAEHDPVHARLGAYSADRCDVIYAVNPGRIGSFTRAAGAGHAQLVEVPTFAAARAALAPNLGKADVVLYENDLPDVLEEKRVL